MWILNALTIVGGGLALVWAALVGVVLLIGFGIVVAAIIGGNVKVTKR